MIIKPKMFTLQTLDDAQETALSPQTQIQVAKPTLFFDETTKIVAVNSKAFGYKKWSGDNTWST